MTVNHAIMKLGKLPPRRDDRVPAMGNYLRVGLPNAPASVDWSKGIVSWGMMQNDQIGDCTAAGAGHAVQVWTANASQEATVTDAQVVAFYSATCGYQPGDPSTDQGGVEVDVLTWWHNNSFGGHKLDAFATLDAGNRTNIRDAIWLLGGAYLGLELPISCQTQTIWDVPETGATGDGAPGSWGGHCVFAIGYDAGGLIVITWGQIKRMTWAFFDAYCSEAYGLLSQEWIKATKAAPSGFDYQALVADMAALQSKAPVKADDGTDPTVLTVHLGKATIDIKEAMVNWAVGLIGASLVAYGQFDPNAQSTWLGGILAVGATWRHFAAVHESNISTKDMAAFALSIISALRSKKSA